MCEFNQNTDLSWSSKSHCSWHHFTSDLPFVPHAPCAKCCFSDSNRYNLDIECNQGKYCFLLLLTEIILRKYVRILKIQMIRKLILNHIPIFRFTTTPRFVSIKINKCSTFTLIYFLK